MIRYSTTRVSLTTLCLVVMSIVCVQAQEVSAEPPMDSEWYYDYCYGGRLEAKDSKPAVGYTKVTTLGKHERYGKEVVAYRMEHITKFGRTVEEPYYIYYDGSRAYLQSQGGGLYLMYDLSLPVGAEIECFASPVWGNEAKRGVKFRVATCETVEIQGAPRVVQRYEPLDAVILGGSDTIRSYTVTQHIGFSHLEALSLVSPSSPDLLFATQRGCLRHYRGGGVSFTPQGATTPYDTINDETSGFTERPLIYGSLWYVMYTQNASTDRELCYTDVYHHTGEVVEQEGKKYHKVEQYFSLDGPNTANKRYIYLRYDAEQGVEYLSGMGYKQGSPGENEWILYDYKTSPGVVALDSTAIPLIRGIIPFVCSLEVDDQLRRRFIYKLHPESSTFASDPYVWIEGVGWDQGFTLYPPGLVGGAPDLLLYAEDQAGRTYGEKKFINTSIDAPSGAVGNAPYRVYHDGQLICVETGSLAGFRGEQFELYDTRGRLVHRVTIVNPSARSFLDITLLPGVYFWSISGGTAPDSVGKILVRQP